MAVNDIPDEIPYARLKERHPEYNRQYWERCRALYKGGPELLENKDILRTVMPKHNAEEDHIYEERLKRAFYIPYAGSIVGKLASELLTDAVNVSTGTDEQLDTFYKEFIDNVGKAKYESVSLTRYVKEQCLAGLVCGSTWALVDLPRAQAYSNRAEQEAAGALRAYVCMLKAESVIDWECDDDGAFKFVLLEDQVNEREGLTGDRDTVILRYRYYTPDRWALYELKYKKKERKQGPKDTDKAVLIATDRHTFKRVPVSRMKLPAGLWAMAQLEAMARAHFNQRNALSWGQLKALFPMPILYASPPSPLDPVSEDEGRTKQRTGPGYLWVLAKDDRMEYFSPDTAPYELAASDLKEIRDEMYRVLHAMAMSIDNSPSALKRSAESKEMDQLAGAAILKALGEHMRQHVLDVFKLVAAGRSEEKDFVVTGMDNFEHITLSQLVEDASTLEMVSVPSATFQRRWKMKIAKAALGPEATPEELQEIEEELEESITQDTFTMATMPADPAQSPLNGEPGNRDPLVD